MNLLRSKMSANTRSRTHRLVTDRPKMVPIWFLICVQLEISTRLQLDLSLHLKFRLWLIWLELKRRNHRSYNTLGVL